MIMISLLAARAIKAKYIFIVNTLGEWRTKNSRQRKRYSKMSNNVPDKIKPFRTLRDFGAGHLGHYETFLYGHRLGPFGTLRDFFLGHYETLWKIFPQALRPPPPPP